MKTKKTKTAKGKKHKPDWPQMFADRIIDLENRVTALERSSITVLPPKTTEAEAAAAAVPVPADVHQ